MQPVYRERMNFERRLQDDKSEAFDVPGFSYPAREKVNFLADFAWSNAGIVNWRERLVCPITGLNNRIRAAVHLMDSELGVLPNESVYITEHVTPLYNFLAEKHPGLVGSEYLGETIPRGASDARGVRNEDLTGRTFNNESFDAVLSFDCFEHMPDFVSGMMEIYRVIKPGGRLMWSVPFRSDLELNLRRASIDPTGSIIHHEPPEYHGDPINSEGCLCFTHFGWQMLDQVKQAGFKNAYAVAYWSDVFGYLGIEQYLFMAEK